MQWPSSFSTLISPLMTDTKLLFLERRVTQSTSRSHREKNTC
ncbi:hypothetical protein RSSM_05689 [Rhodopirellula sallentina SM41]|uniref:Uncharacterized protein n=1 Tax=Rhodopirellula sallentina SM41 TaxID=1263870 RepID=M5TUN4_9BACT|nr:hypothetical protein RSSM_05689 [Rhodopirellula sallentina SM41]